MNEVTIAKAAWLAIIFAGIVLVSAIGRDSETQTPLATKTSTTGSNVRLITLANGRQGIADAGGQVVPLQDYHRIAGGSIVADELLLALAEPERIVALSHYGRTHARNPHAYGDRVEISGAGDVELLRKHEVELLFVHHLGVPAELARVRDAGIEVFNLGEMRGIATLIPNIETVATLLGDPDRGVRLAESFQRRLQAVAVDVPNERRKRAIYLSAYGGQLFGGAARTSYHDVLTAAGLIDAAAYRFSDWPHYDPEQVLALDPEVIITTEASVAPFCRISGFDHLRACSRKGLLIGIPEARIGDPGLAMLDTAEEIRDRVYGPSR
jgi:iron complex transport system substrate-binding protein